MKLSSLNLGDKKFFEKERSALEQLPRTEEGKAELLDHLKWIDSLEGYLVLYHEFLPLLTEEERNWADARVKKIFDPEVLRLYSCFDDFLNRD